VSRAAGWLRSHPADVGLGALAVLVADLVALALRVD
jgi:hypothetical protein